MRIKLIYIAPLLAAGAAAVAIAFRVAGLRATIPRGALVLVRSIRFR